MPQNEEKDAAAIAAAGFDLMLLSTYYSAHKGIVAVHLGQGLAEGGLASEAQELIERLADDDAVLKGTPATLAAKDRIACIALGELFAIALSNQDETYLQTIVPMDNKSAAISRTLDEMNATTLAKCFRPTLN